MRLADQKLAHVLEPPPPPGPDPLNLLVGVAYCHTPSTPLLRERARAREECKTPARARPPETRPHDTRNVGVGGVPDLRHAWSEVAGNPR